MDCSISAKHAILIDLKCAALPAIMMHETHEHPLFQKEAEAEGLCYSCGVSAQYGDLIFKCISCDVYLDYNCAMLSRSIRHREHPILPKYPHHGDHPNHFMCDMCEELIHPERWLYSCIECDVSFHFNCAPRYQKHPNMKFGGKVKISSHPHILKHIREPTLKITCDDCEGKLVSIGVFECEVSALSVGDASWTR
ncbi:hypothetical protein LIER_43944 [Lithospermum erythrorhizon]|uniref:DC1 domain-containing protein n=1 Tax=Lithospermum erythrorhizon TaxID=34254 RepID=A0AAV3R7Y7_LITER